MRLHCCIFSLLIAVSCLAQLRRDFDVVYDAFNADITNTNHIFANNSATEAGWAIAVLLNTPISRPEKKVLRLKII